jgi:hypothetical protein
MLTFLIKMTLVIIERIKETRVPLKRLCDVDISTTENCCDRFDGTSDMNAATQRPGTDFGVSYATVFRIHGINRNPLLRNVYKQNGYFR